MVIFSGFINSLYSSCVKTPCGGRSCSLGPVHRGFGGGLYKVVREILVGRLVSTVSCQTSGKVAVGLGEDIKGALA